MCFSVEQEERTKRINARGEWPTKKFATQKYRRRANPGQSVPKSSEPSPHPLTGLMKMSKYGQVSVLRLFSFCKAHPGVRGGSPRRCACHFPTYRSTRGDSPRTPRVVSPNYKLLAAQLTFSLTQSWGILPVLIPVCESVDEMLDEVSDWTIENKAAKPGDRIIVTAGVPIHVPGSTNLIKVMEIEKPVRKKQAKKTTKKKS